MGGPEVPWKVLYFVRFLRGPPGVLISESLLQRDIQHRSFN